MPIRTSLVTAYKDGKYIFIDAHPWKYERKAELIVQSLIFR
jgi:hypothetical protein